MDFTLDIPGINQKKCGGCGEIAPCTHEIYLDNDFCSWRCLAVALRAELIRQLKPPKEV